MVVVFGVWCFWLVEFSVRWCWCVSGDWCVKIDNNF